MTTATAAAETADLLLWVVGSDGLQQETMQPILRMLHRRVPLIVVVNHKETRDLHELDRLSDDDLLPDRDARKRRLTALLPRVGRSRPTVVHVHLDVARCARTDGHDIAWRRSGVPELEEAMAEACAEALRSRPVTRINGLRALMAAVMPGAEAALRGLGDLGLRRTVLLEALIADSAVSASAFSKNLKAGFRSATRTADADLTAVSRAALEKEHRRKAQDGLQTAVAVLCQQHASDLVTVARDALSSAAESMPTDGSFTREAVVAMAVDVPTLELMGDPDTARFWANTRKVAAAGSMVLSLLPGGILAGIAVGTIAPIVVNGVGKGLAPSLEEEWRRRDDSIKVAAEQIRAVLNSQRRQARSRAKDLHARAVEAPLAMHLEQLQARCSQLEAMYDEVHGLVELTRAAVRG